MTKLLEDGWGLAGNLTMAIAADRDLVIRARAMTKVVSEKLPDVKIEHVHKH